MPIASRIVELKEVKWSNLSWMLAHEKRLRGLTADFDIGDDGGRRSRPREAPAKDGPENLPNLASKSHFPWVIRSRKATFRTRVVTCDFFEKIPKIQNFRTERKFRKIFSSKLARKATFWDKGGQILASKSHLLDKEMANFRSEKATFSDHPLHELPGACRSAAAGSIRCGIALVDATAGDDTMGDEVWEFRGAGGA
ncbi:hypothetical protein B0H14DRAFT_2644603 [Mycena olivaceomarginata]|nr:hypothetical protein B0H14DRAFT_2644603 [Mycena olivaceomarginata]